LYIDLVSFHTRALRVYIITTLLLWLFKEMTKV